MKSLILAIKKDLKMKGLILFFAIPLLSFAQVWEQTFGQTSTSDINYANDESYCVQQTIDGGYIFAVNPTYGGFNLIKVNEYGNVEFLENFPGEGIYIEDGDIKYRF